jgi:cytochrome bd ubiquinol oxidase subunit I
MDNFAAARSQMGMSLGFHIVFAVIGVALPLMMTIAEWRFRATGDAAYLLLAKRWAKGTTILFAVGAVSGTVLSFELGLLWPQFMRYAGSIIGMPFSLEGFAFFTEAVFLGIYLYGWDKVPGWLHVLSGFIVALSASISDICYLRQWLDEYAYRIRFSERKVCECSSAGRHAEPGFNPGGSAHGVSGVYCGWICDRRYS